MGFKHVSFRASTADVKEKKAAPVAPKTKAEPKALTFAQDTDPQSVEAAWQAAGRKSTITSDKSDTLAAFGFSSAEGPAWRTSVTNPADYPVKDTPVQTAAVTLAKGKLGSK
jgi:hypothetical protein